MRGTSEPSDQHTPTAPGAPGVPEAIAAFEAAMTALLAVDLDELGVRELERLVGVNERGVRRLEANRATLTATLSSRAAARARAERPDDPRAGERAARTVRRRLVDHHRMSPSQAKQAVTTGRQLADLPTARAAAADGDLSAAHLRVLEQTLRHLVGDVREATERELVTAARQQDPVTFGRTCRRRLAQLDHDAAMADLHRLRARRSGRLAQDPSGMTHLAVDVAGIDAEWLATAVHAFRRRDAADERRTPEQRTADAVVDMARAALSALEDPDKRGVRPLVLLTLPDPDPGATAAWQVGETLHNGPLPRGELQRLLGDAHLAAVLADARRAPTAVTRKVRSVPRALWRSLVARDRTCIWPGCDVPAAWCQVMHTDIPYRHDGRLSLTDAALGCHQHHTLVDTGAYRVRFVDGRPRVVRHDGAPVAGGPTDATAGGHRDRSRIGRPPDPG